MKYKLSIFMIIGMILLAGCNQQDSVRLITSDIEKQPSLLELANIIEDNDSFEVGENIDNISAYEIAKNNPYVEDVYEFPLLPGTKEWKEIGDSQQLKEMLQIPEDVIKDISTEGLVYTVFAYPYLLDMTCFNHLEDGIASVKASFNGFGELYNRPYFGGYIIKVYEAYIIEDPSQMSQETDGTQLMKQWAIRQFMTDKEFISSLGIKDLEQLKVLLEHENSLIKESELPFMDSIYGTNSAIINKIDFRLNELGEQKDEVYITIDNPASYLYNEPAFKAYEKYKEVLNYGQYMYYFEDFGSGIVYEHTLAFETIEEVQSYYDLSSDLQVIEGYTFYQGLVLSNIQEEVLKDKEIKIGDIYQMPITGVGTDELSLSYKDIEEQKVSIDISRYDRMNEEVNDTYATDLEIDGQKYHYLIYTGSNRIRSITTEYLYKDDLLSVTLFIAISGHEGFQFEENTPIKVEDYISSEDIQTLLSTFF